jgi:antitoxin (DNA-binding transcriptional repressor) of toxin-antitoxin stability system
MTKPRVVGIADLKAHLSEYLEDVRGGAELIVKHRARAIALISPLRASTSPTTEGDLDALVAEGLLVPPRTRRTSAQIAKAVCAASARSPRLAGSTLLEALLADRAEAE